MQQHIFPNKKERLHYYHYCEEIRLVSSTTKRNGLVRSSLASFGSSRLGPLSSLLSSPLLSRGSHAASRRPRPPFCLHSLLSSYKTNRLIRRPPRFLDPRIPAALPPTTTTLPCRLSPIRPRAYLYRRPSGNPQLAASLARISRRRGAVHPGGLVKHKTTKTLHKFWW